jgi:hypothetical protein
MGLTFVFPEEAESSSNVAVVGFVLIHYLNWVLVALMHWSGFRFLSSISRFWKAYRYIYTSVLQF